MLRSSSLCEREQEFWLLNTDERSGQHGDPALPHQLRGVTGTRRRS